MPLRRRTSTFAFVLASGLLAPATGHADVSAQTTLYVNNASGSNCSDAGTGTIAQPYCTIQAAVAVVNPGQTVYIEPGTYNGPIDITRSGTAAAPITITAPDPADGFFTTHVRTTPASTSALIDFTDVQYVDMSNIEAAESVGDGIRISGSSNIALDQVGFIDAGDLQQPHPLVAGIHVTGGSSEVRIQRSEVLNAYGSGIEVDGGSTGTMLSTNLVQEPLHYEHLGISVNSAPQTTITSNTVTSYCSQALVVDSGSTGAVIENNVLSDWRTQTDPACPTNTLTLDTLAAPSAVADYNFLYNSAGGSEYSWGGSDYATPAAFAAGTGQGLHDEDYPGTKIPSLREGDVIPVDSANSAAPGELSTDVLGRPRVDDPLISNTGVGPYTYYDRGAEEAQEFLFVNLSAPTTRAPVGGNVKFSVAVTDPWATSYSYTFDFGDGTKITDSTGVEEHAYTATGVYTVTVTVTSSYGGTTTRSMSIIIDAPTPLAPSLAGGFGGSGNTPLTLTVNWLDGTTYSWDPTSATIDFGDCSAPFTTSQPSLLASALHVYTVPGVYTVTLTVTDAGGNTATTSKAYATPGAASYKSCGRNKILIAPNAAGGTRPAITLSATSGGLVGSGFDGAQSAPVGSASQDVESFSGGGLLGASVGVPR